MDYILVKDKSSEKFSGQGGTQIKLEANESHYPILKDLGIEYKHGGARCIVPHSIPQVLNMFSRYGYRVVCCASCGNSANVLDTCQGGLTQLKLHATSYH